MKLTNAERDRLSELWWERLYEDFPECPRCRGELEFDEHPDCTYVWIVCIEDHEHRFDPGCGWKVRRYYD